MEHVDLEVCAPRGVPLSPAGLCSLQGLRLLGEDIVVAFSLRAARGVRVAGERTMRKVEPYPSLIPDQISLTGLPGEGLLSSGPVITNTACLERGISAVDPTITNRVEMATKTTLALLSARLIQVKQRNGDIFLPIIGQPILRCNSITGLANALNNRRSSARGAR